MANFYDEVEIEDMSFDKGKSIAWTLCQERKAQVFYTDTCHLLKILAGQNSSCDLEYYADTKLENGLYHFPCPCGDRFEITLAQLKEGDDVARCPSCSLIINVIYDQDDYLSDEGAEEVEIEIDISRHHPAAITAWDGRVEKLEKTTLGAIPTHRKDVCIECTISYFSHENPILRSTRLVSLMEDAMVMGPTGFEPRLKLDTKGSHI